MKACKRGTPTKSRGFGFIPVHNSCKYFQRSNAQPYPVASRPITSEWTKASQSPDKGRWVIGFSISRWAHRRCRRAPRDWSTTDTRPRRLPRTRALPQSRTMITLSRTTTARITSRISRIAATRLQSLLASGLFCHFVSYCSQQCDKTQDDDDDGDEGS